MEKNASKSFKQRLQFFTRALLVFGFLLCLCWQSSLYAAPRKPKIALATESPLPAVPPQPVYSEIISPGSSGAGNETPHASLTLSPSKLISFDYTNANLSDVLKAIAYSYNLNIVVTKDITGKVSAKLKDLTLEDALNAILSVNGYGFMRKGNILYIMPKADMQPLIESVPLSFISPKEAETFLTNVIKGTGQIQANESTNSLIIKGDPTEIQNVKDIIKTVDVPPIQVLIEAKIVDIEDSDIQNIGTTINLKYNPTSGHLSTVSFSSGTSDNGGNNSTSSSTDVGTGAASTSNGDGGVFTLGGKWKNISPDVTIDALVQQHKARVLASPSISTLNGKEASITIGEKVAYRASTATTGSTTTNSTQFADIGTKLQITPMISTDGWITLKVHPEVSSLLQTTDAGPNIATREADAFVRVHDNQTIVIGGLINRSDLRDRNGVPFLKDIPVLGWLFQRHSDQITNGNLTVFITPHIVPMPPKNLPDAEKKISNIDLSSTHDQDMLSGLLTYADSLEQDKSKDYAKNLYLSEEQIKAYRMILQQFPKSGKSDYCLYRIAFIYAKEFGRCESANEALTEMKDFSPQSPYVNVTESLVNACVAINAQKSQE